MHRARNAHHLPFVSAIADRRRTHAESVYGSGREGTISLSFSVSPPSKCTKHVYIYIYYVCMRKRNLISVTIAGVKVAWWGKHGPRARLRSARFNTRGTVVIRLSGSVRVFFFTIQKKKKREKK